MSSRAPPNRLLPLLALAAVSILLGAGHVFARYAFINGVPVLTAGAVRLVLTAMLLAALLALRRESPFVGRLRFAWTVPIGLCIALQNVSIQSAVALMPVGVAVLVFYTFPFFTGIASSWLGDVRFSVRLGVTLFSALAGLAFVLGVSAESINPLGVALAVVAALGFTAALLLTPRLGVGLSAPVRTFFTMLIAGIVLAAIAIARGELRWPDTTAGRIGLTGLSLCYAIGISTLFLVLPRLGAVQVAVVMNLEPVAVAMIAWLALGETLSATQLFGAFLVVGSVILYQTRRD